MATQYVPHPNNLYSMIEMEKVFVIYTDMLIMPLVFVVIVNQLTTFVLLFPIV